MLLLVLMILTNIIKILMDGKGVILYKMIKSVYEDTFEEDIDALFKILL